MSPADRLRAAYKTVDDAAPALAVGNDTTSGYTIIAHAALAGLQSMSPAKAKTFLEGWAKTVDDELDRRAAASVQ